MKRVSLVGLCCLALAACGGGGSGSGTPVAPLPAATPTPASTPAGSQAKVAQTVQRALAQQTLQTQQVSQESSIFSVASPQWAAGAVRRDLDAAAIRITAAWRPGAPVHPAARRIAAVTYSACSNGLETATVSVSATEAQMYERQFYDTACTTLYRATYMDLLASGTTGAGGTGTIAEYAKDGSQLWYDTLQLSMTNVQSPSAQISVDVTDAPAPNAPQIGAAGISCGAASASASCGAAAVAHEQSLSQDLGASMLLTLASGSSGVNTTLTISGSAQSETGALNSISIAPDAANFPSWDLSSSGGMTKGAAFGITGQLTFTASGVPLSGSITAADTADDGTAVLSFTAQGVTGSVTQSDTGAVLATFTVDDNGDGSITYSDGMTEQISGWEIAG